MKYYLDTEFLEGTQKKFFGKTKPTIDLISIGLVSEDGREYYAISKDFNLKEAWNRYDLEMCSGDMRNIFPKGRKVYWIRENVLNTIFMELIQLEREYLDKQKPIIGYSLSMNYEWSYSNFKRLLRKFGKHNKEISKEIIKFCEPVIPNLSEGEIECEYQMTEGSYHYFNCTSPIGDFSTTRHIEEPEFYTYYGDYDWVVFCWLFGKMIDLPKGFPMYSKDLKQTLDEKVNVCLDKENKRRSFHNSELCSFEEGFKMFKTRKNFPKQSNEHNALADAKWNLELHKFLETDRF